MVFIMKLLLKSMHAKHTDNAKPEIPDVTIAKLNDHNYLLIGFIILRMYPIHIRANAVSSQIFNNLSLILLYFKNIRQKHWPTKGLITAVKVENNPSGSDGYILILYNFFNLYY